MAFHPQSAHTSEFSQAEAPLCWALYYCEGSQSGCDQTQIVPSVASCSPCLSRVLRQTCYPHSHPPFLLLPLTRRLLFTESVSFLTSVLEGVVTSFWWTGRGTVLRRPGSLADRGLLLLLYCIVMSWVFFSVFLSHSVVHIHTHTHTHMHTDRHIHLLSPPPVCHHNQHSRCLAVTPVLTLI